MTAISPVLLTPDDPPPVTALPERRPQPFVLVCDHASNRLPKSLGSLGLSDTDLARHIGWDIGAAGVTRLMAERLGAAAILQNYSRLAIDCNRPLASDTLIAPLSERTVIPGNQLVSAAAREARIAEIYRPYHDRIAQELDRRGDRPTCLVSVHSFTPVYKGEARPMHAGILYNRDDRIAGPLLHLLQADEDLIVGDNVPYALNDESDYTVPVHGEQRGLPHVEIEIRQDLIADAAGRKIWADRLSSALVSTWNSHTSES